MTIKQAIEKAIDGGYDYGELFDTLVTPHKRIVGDDGGLILLEDDGIVIGTLDKEKYLLSPEFWMSLGKAMGWCEYAVCIHDGKMNCFEKNHWAGYMGEWKWKWHRFVDALSEGKSPEDFFNEL